MAHRLPFVAAVRQEPASPTSSSYRRPVTHLAQAADLGLHGMQLRRRAVTAEPGLPLRTKVQVCFELPDGGQMVELRAEVVFDRPHEGARCRTTGLRFADPAPEVTERLRSFLSRPTP